MTAEIVVAADSARGIGYSGCLPWPRLPRDLQRLKDLTAGRIVVVGRKTFESMELAYSESGRVMPGSHYVVVSRTRRFQGAAVTTAESPDEALVQAVSYDWTTPPVIIGGTQVFEALLPIVSRIYYTRIQEQFDCDVFFPELDALQWRVSSSVSYSADAKNPLNCEFLTYDRR